MRKEDGKDVRVRGRDEGDGGEEIKHSLFLSPK